MLKSSTAVGHLSRHNRRRNIPKMVQRSPLARRWHSRAVRRAPRIGSGRGPRACSRSGTRTSGAHEHPALSLESNDTPDGAGEHRRQARPHRADQRVRLAAARHRRGACRARGQGAGDPGGQRSSPDVRRQASFELPPGAPAISDPVDLDVPALANISISLFCRRSRRRRPCTGRSRDAFIVKGDQTGEADFKSDSTIVSRLFVSEVMVDAAPGARAVVAFGDSITDGDGSTVDGNDRWRMCSPPAW